MVNRCPHCGLPLSTIASSEHDAIFPDQQGLVATLTDACVFSQDGSGVPMAVAMPDTLPEDVDGLRGLPGEGFLMPSLPEDRLTAAGVVWCRFRGEGRHLPLAAVLLGARQPAAELVWSWFREAVAAFEALHSLGLVHGRVDESLFLVTTRSGDGPAVGNRLRLLAPMVSRPPDEPSLAVGRAADLRALARLFGRLVQEAPWQRGLEEFRALCLAMQEEPEAGMEEALAQVAGARRMSQLEAPAPAPVHARIEWKRPAMIFGPLILLSLLATWWFAGGKERRTAVPPPPALRRPPPVQEPVVERLSLKWDPEFPLHQVALLDQVLLYLVPSRIPQFAMLAEAAGLLGFTIPEFSRSQHAESLIQLQLQLSGERWKQRLTFSMTKDAGTTPGSGAPPATPPTSGPSSAPPSPPRWVVHTGAARLLRPDAISPPPLLLGELGELLSMTGYSPERVSQESLVLILAPPPSLAPRHTVWHQLLGGVRPTYAVLRLSATDERLHCVLSFERPVDAQGAASFLGNLSQASGIPSEGLLKQESRRVFIRIKLAALAELWKAANAPAPAPSTPGDPGAPDIPPPPVVPPSEEPPAPDPAPMEFLAIPEP